MQVREFVQPVDGKIEQLRLGSIVASVVSQSHGHCMLLLSDLSRHRHALIDLWDEFLHSLNTSIGIGPMQFAIASLYPAIL